MYGQSQSNFFLPDGLSNSSSSSIDSAFNMGIFGQELGFTSSSRPSVPPLSSLGHASPLSSFGSLGQATSLSSLVSLGQQENSAFRRHLDHVINGKEGKMFVGGLSWLSTTDSMRSYFEKYGPVEECVIMRDAKTKITRGFGFVTFENPTHIQRVLSVKDHFLDGKRIDPQVAIRHISPARSVNNICRKVFIGGVSQLCSIDDVKNYFSQFGPVEDAILKMDYPKHQHRGFGFMTFVNSETADLVCTIRYHVLKDKTVECKMAQKKEFVKPNGEAAAAASTFLNSLPPEQVLAICSALFRTNNTNGAQAPSNPPQTQIPQSLQSGQSLFSFNQQVPSLISSTPSLYSPALSPSAQPLLSQPLRPTAQASPPSTHSLFQSISQPAYMFQKQTNMPPPSSKLPGPVGSPRTMQRTQEIIDAFRPVDAMNAFQSADAMTLQQQKHHNAMIAFKTQEQKEIMAALQKQQQNEHDQLMLDTTSMSNFHRQLAAKYMIKPLSEL